MLRIGPPRIWLYARLTTLFSKEFIVAKSKEVEATWSKPQEWTNLTQSFKDGYSSKRVFSPMVMMIMMTTTTAYRHMKPV
jgi:hypothetical protein